MSHNINDSSPILVIFILVRRSRTNCGLLLPTVPPQEESSRSAGPTREPTNRANRATASSFGARLLRAMPLQKLKIIAAVWQFETQVCYPIQYSRSHIDGTI